MSFPTQLSPNSTAAEAPEAPSKQAAIVANRTPTANRFLIRLPSKFSIRRSIEPFGGSRTNFLDESLTDGFGLGVE